MADDIKNVFISHVHEDDAGLADLKALIAKGGLTVRDSSINSSNPNEAKDPDYIKSQILAPQIQWASTLLVYMTPQDQGQRVGLPFPAYFSTKCWTRSGISSRRSRSGGSSIWITFNR
jgi:Thoeris protein ThsB, TIR-like domain